MLDTLITLVITVVLAGWLSFRLELIFIESTGELMSQLLLHLHESQGKVL